MTRLDASECFYVGEHVRVVYEGDSCYDHIGVVRKHNGPEIIVDCLECNAWSHWSLASSLRLERLEKRRLEVLGEDYYA